MTWRAIEYDDYEWITRPDRPARHVAELSEALGAAQVRMNVWRYEPGARGKRHRHVAQDETFVVVRGVLTMYLGEEMERVEAVPGDVVHIGHGTPLQTANEGEEDLVVYVHGWPPEDENAELLPSAV
jgi:quercetin dioxygenase-like cupin family protein